MCEINFYVDVFEIRIHLGRSVVVHEKGTNTGAYCSAFLGNIVSSPPFDPKRCHRTRLS